MLKLVNALSLNMLEGDCILQCRTVSLEKVKEIWLDGRRIYLLDKETVIDHKDLAAIVGAMIGIPIRSSRESVWLNPGDECLVAQYTGPRLPEGTTTLPEGAKIVWWHVGITALPKEQRISTFH